MRSRLIVTSAVLAPIRAAACAASQPAWPAPITITSKSSSKLNISRRLSDTVSKSQMNHRLQLLLTDTERRENPVQNIVNRCFASHFAERTQCAVQTDEGKLLTQPAL